MSRTFDFTITARSLRELPQAERRERLVERLADPTAATWDVNAARRVAFTYGLWTELAARFPQHFGESFALRGSGPADDLLAPPAARPEAPSVSLAEVADLVGHETLVRVARGDDRVSVFVGTLLGVHPTALQFSALNAAKARALMHAGDAIECVDPFPVESDKSLPVVYLYKGDRILTAAAVDGPMPPKVATHAPRRVNIRGRAEAVLRGEYQPRVDLSRAHEHMRRDASGTVILNQHDQPVFSNELVAAVKIEQNVLAAAICKELLPRLATAMADESVIAGLLRAGRSREETLEDLRARLVARADNVVDKLCHELAAQPDTPLGAAYANLATILDFQREHMAVYFSRGDLPETETFFLRGFGTASRAMVGVANVAGDLGAPDLGKVVSGSYPLFLQLAAMHLQPFVTMVDGGNLWDAKNFELTGDRDRVVLRKTFVEEFARLHGVDVDSVLEPTTGCPAKVAFGVGNPLSPLFEAVAVQVNRLYPPE